MKRASLLKKVAVWAALLAAECLVLPSAGTADPNAPFLAGYGQVEITPGLGAGMPGYFTERKADGVLDPLLAKALVLTRGKTTLAIVAVDLLNIRREFAQDIRTAVEQRTGIPAEKVFLHATHTHTGVRTEEIADALPGQVAEAVENARADRSPQSHVTYGVGEEHRVAFIRRFLMDDGTVRTNPGRGNPHVVRPMGFIDPRVHVLTFPETKTLLVSFGLHLDCVGGTKFSADYPYHLTEAVREALGDDWNVVYLNACCGNVNHINIHDRSPQKGYENSRWIGRSIAETAIAAHRAAAPIEIDALAAGEATIPCKPREVPAEMLEWARAQMNDDAGAASQRKFNERTPSRIVALAERAGQTNPSEVIAFRIGPVGLVGLPAEVFVEIGRDIQRHSLLSPTLVIGLTGGSMGYVPHPRGYDESGYESTFASARYSSETPTAWSDAATKMLNEMAAGK